MAAEPYNVFEFERCFKFLLHDKTFLVLISQRSAMPCGFWIPACFCFIISQEKLPIRDMQSDDIPRNRNLPHWKASPGPIIILSTSSATADENTGFKVTANVTLGLDPQGMLRTAAFEPSAPI